MHNAVLPAWSDAQKRDLGRQAVVFDHRLVETGLFEDAALARLLDAYPDEMIDINLFESDDASGLNLRTGVRGGLSGQGMLDAVRAGRVWIQLRRADRHCPEMGAAIARCFAEIERQVKGFRAADVYGQLLLSAPGARVPYHADAPNVLLFHIRGRKRVYIYPTEEFYLPATSLEGIVMRTQTEDLPYHRGMDAGAQVFDLEPGQALAWPQHAPHRVENLEGVCVSFSADYQTWGSRITNGAHLFNGVLRRAGVQPRPIEGTAMAARALMWGGGLILKRLGLVPERLKGDDFEKTFDLAASRSELASA